MQNITFYSCFSVELRHTIDILCTQPGISLPFFFLIFCPAQCLLKQPCLLISHFSPEQETLIITVDSSFHLLAFTTSLLKEKKNCSIDILHSFQN